MSADNPHDHVPVRDVTVRDHDAIDSWIPVLADVGQLARSLADTDFVPAGMRGKPAAVAAAILSARELGVGPMTGLAHLYVVHGKVGMSAQLMRQLILAAGHDLRYLETTDTRCVVEGRRRGTEDWARVTFTADQSRKARIDLGQYAEDKLVARATSRLARRLFADCLGGVPYLAEELEDPAVRDTPDPGTYSAAGEGVEPPRRRVAQRKASPRPLQPPPPELPAAAPTGPPTASAAVGSVDLDDPPLDDPPLGEEPTGDAGMAAGGAPVGPEPTVQPTTDKPATRAQLTAIAAAMNALGYRDRGERLRLTSRLTGRGIATGNDLTRAEAGALLDTLTHAQNSPDPQGRIIDIVEAAQQPTLGDSR